MTDIERAEEHKRGGDLASVTFEFPEALAPRAVSVSVLGPFNAWTRGVHPLKRTGAGTWSARVFLPPGRIVYCFDVDGTAWLDPADEGRIPNGWGSEYSIRYVGRPRRPAEKRRRLLALHPIAGGSQVCPLEHSLERRPDASVVTLAGEIDLSTVTTLRSVLEHAVQQERPVIVDMSRVAYIDSSGLAELVALYRLAQRRGQRFSLAAPSRLLAKLLQLTRLTETIPTYPTVDAAVDAGAAGGGGPEE
jgi:anti-sigma B factor antagonist